MEEWNQYKLIDVLDKLIDYRGKTPKKTTSGVPLITAKIIKNGRIETPTEFISVDDYDSWMVRGFPKVGDVVLTTEAPLGEVAQLDNENIALAQRVVTLRGKASVLDNTYLKYYLMSNVGQQRLKARETGTTVTGIKQSELREVLIDCPPYEFQQKIASILKSLDDKIEVNRRINDNLEQQTQALFKSWFIDFEPFKDGEFVESELGMIPKGWRIGKLNEILVLQKNNIKKGADTTLPYLPIDIIPMHSLGVTEFKDNSEAQSSLQTFEKNEIIVGAMRVYFHRVVIAPCKGITRNTCFVLKPKNIEMWAYSILQCNQEDAIDYANRTSKGSTMPYAVWDNGFGNYKIIIPKLDLLRRFNNLLYPFLEKLRDSYKENLVLSNIRDTLLPKLMSGELRVPDTDLIDEMLEKGIR